MRRGLHEGNRVSYYSFVSERAENRHGSPEWPGGSEAGLISPTAGLRQAIRAKFCDIPLYIYETNRVL